MNTILKKILSIGMSLIIATTSNIQSVNFNDAEWLHNVSSYEYVEQIGPEVIRCLKEQDRERLNNLFCDKVKNTEYLKKEIDYLFDYIDENGGMIINEDGQWTVPGEHRTFSDKGTGKVVSFFGCKYWGKIIIKEKEYVLHIDTYSVLKKHLEYVGVVGIGLTEKINRNLIAKDDYMRYLNSNEEDDSYLGFNIFNFDYNIFKYESIMPQNMYEVKEYSYSFDELEKGASSW